MTSRERVRKAINHQVTDRVPIDLGGTTVSTIHILAMKKLREHLGLKSNALKAADPLLLVGEVDEELREALQVDCVDVGGVKNSLGLLNTDHKQWKLTEETEIMVCGGFAYKRNDDGSVFAYAEGNLGYPPSAKLSAGSYYFDPIVRQEENAFEKEVWNARKDYAGLYPKISEEELRLLEKRSKDLFENTQCSLVGSYTKAGFGDAFHIPGPWQKETKGIRNFEDWLVTLFDRPEYICELFEMQAEVGIESLKLYHEAVGDKVDVLRVSSTDFAHQNGLMISRDLYREIFMPYCKRVNDWIHNNTNWKTMMHSCGAVKEMIPDFIEAGFDILNPVQVSAKGMDAEELKTRFGKDIVFWGGGCDPQKTMSNATPEEVYAETKKNAEILSRGGGFVGGNVHNIQYDVSPENIVAELQALKDTVPQSGGGSDIT